MSDNKSLKKTEYNNKYNKDHYERINIVFPKGTKEKVTEAAGVLDISISEFIRQAVDEKIDAIINR